MLKDKYDRVHNYLRISLTDNCNLRCFYCMPEEDYLFMPNNKLMQADGIHPNQQAQEKILDKVWPILKE